MDRDKENQEQLDLFYGVDRPKEQRQWLDSHYQSYRSDDPPSSSSQDSSGSGYWTQRENERRDGRSPSNGGSNSRGGRGGRMGGILLFLVLFAAFAVYGHNAIADVIRTSTAASEPTKHFLQNWLSLLFNVFLPVSTLILLITILLRRFWAGTVLVIATGILSFIGTGIYLVISGIFFGK